MFRPLLEVKMSKKCTPLWREAHLEVKMHKISHVRTILQVEMSKKCTPFWSEAHLEAKSATELFFYLANLSIFLSMFLSIYLPNHLAIYCYVHLSVNKTTFCQAKCSPSITFVNYTSAVFEWTIRLPGKKIDPIRRSPLLLERAFSRLQWYTTSLQEKVQNM